MELTQLITEKTHTSTFRDDEFGIQTAVLVEAKRPDSKSITPWELGVEWLTGTGARSREFEAGDFITELYRQHDFVSQTKQEIAQKIRESAGQLPIKDVAKYDLNGIEGVGKYIKDYSTLATGGKTGNLIYTFLGSHVLMYEVTSVDIENRTAVVTFTVHNTSTMQSATRPPVIGYKEWYRNSIGKVINKLFKSGPGSETEQWIEWTETITY